MKSLIRLIPVCLLLLLFAIPAVAQANKKPEEEDNLYSMALFSSVAQMEKSWGYIDDSNGGTTLRTDYRHMYVVKDPEITDKLPTKSGVYSVEYLDEKAQFDLYRKLGKDFAILKILPIRNSGSRLELTINVYYVSFTKHKRMFGLSDWSTVGFRFDCDQQKFVLSSVKLGGI